MIEKFSSPENFQAALEKAVDAVEDNGTEEKNIPAPEPEAEKEANAEELKQEEAEEEEPKAKEPAPEEEDDDDYDTIKTDKGRYIPLGRFKREKERMAAIEAERKREREEFIQLKTQYDSLNNMINDVVKGVGKEGQGVQEDYEPLDAEADARYKKEIAKVKEESDKGLTAMQQQMAQMMVAQQEAAFQARTPDYAEALQYLGQKKVEESTIITGGNEQLALQVVGASMRNIVDTALASGKNPAEVLYQMAKANGFAGKQDVAAPKKEKGMNLDAISKNQAKSSSVNNIPGTSAPSSNAVLSYNKEDMKKILTEKKSVDPEGFQKLLRKVTANASA